MAQLFDEVRVDLIKLWSYCLSESHPRGRHKARVFRARLGATSQHAEHLRDQFIAAVAEAAALERGAVENHGERYGLDIVVTVDDRRAVLRTRWIIRKGERVLRFVTCHVL